MTGGSYVLDHSDPPSGGSIDSVDSAHSYEAPHRGERANYVRQNAVQSPVLQLKSHQTPPESPTPFRRPMDTTCHHDNAVRRTTTNQTKHVNVTGLAAAATAKNHCDVRQMPAPLFGAGYDNLAVGYFMPSPKSVSVGSNCIIPAPNRVDASTTMHLDFLVSPGESSDSSGQPLSPDEIAPFLNKNTTFDPNAQLSPSLQDEDGLDSLFAVSSSDLFGGVNLTGDQALSSPTPSDISLILLSPGRTELNSLASEQSYTAEHQEQTQVKAEEVQNCQLWSRYPVLPPVVNPQYFQSENVVCDQHQQPAMPPCYGNTLPLFGTAFADSLCSSSFASTRNSITRSSYSGRGSRNKRALSNSPLSAEGIDFNALIRSSPTSLFPVLHRSSISSSSSASGCYGHLSARNSNGSPRSTSIASSHQWTIPYTPLSTTSTQTNLKDDFPDVDSNVLTYQSMQLLETGLAEVVPALDNHVVLPQNNLQQLEQELYGHPHAPSGLPPLARPPPPSYDQHMARRKLLLCQNSSDSSQPSNYSSFDSSEGTVEGPYLCRWIDCSHVFLEQEELVKHIEKAHVDQRKGDEFVCFWQGCVRKLQPFNARYKLLVHMRVHSGDKPNKCTFDGCTRAFSRLENLKIHFRSHTGEKPYSCQYVGCFKAFSNSSDRAKHQRTHQDTKPYACQVAGCTKRYTDPSSLRKHVKNHMTKSDQAKKKLRGGLEVDPDLLSECLTIQPLRPMSHCDCASPPEPTDSGLGRSPHAFLAASSTESYSAGVSYSMANTHQNLSNQTSPSSHHSSPAHDDSCDTSNRLTLPPIHQSARQPQHVIIHTQIVTTNQQEMQVKSGRSHGHQRILAPLRCQTSLPPLRDAFTAIYESNRTHSGGIS